MTIKEQTETMNSIVVLPFKNLSADPDNEYFADGITEEIIASLSKINDLKVISRRSAFQFKGKQVDARLIGHRLGVTSILDGSLRQAGDQLRINAQLINTSDDTLLWSKRYEQQMGDIFEIQDEIAGSIMEQLEVSFDQGSKLETVKVSHSGNRNLAAYQFYLKGLFQWNLRTKESGEAALELFKRALQEDSQYALAHSGLSLTYRFLFSQGHATDLENIELAKEHAERALKLDENLAEAHISMAVIYREHEWDWENALAHASRAVELSPNNAVARGSLSEVLRCLGQFDQAILEREKSIELDPLNVNHYTALCYTNYMAGRYKEGLGVLDQIEAVESGYQFIQHYRGILNVQLGSYDVATKNFEAEVVEWRRRFGMILTYQKLKEEKKARELLERFISDYGEAGAYQIGVLCVQLGDLEEGFTWLNVSLKKKDGGIADVKHDPLLADVQDDVRYAEILEALNLDEQSLENIIH